MGLYRQTACLRGTIVVLRQVTVILITAFGVFLPHLKGETALNHRAFDIFTVAVLALVGVALAFAVPADNVAGRILTLPLVFLLPGYAMTSALFAKQNLGVTERVVLSLGFS